MKIITRAFAIVNEKAAKMFASACGLDFNTVTFCGNLIKVRAESVEEAKLIYIHKYNLLSFYSWSWNQIGVEIYWQDTDGRVRMFFVAGKSKRRNAKLINVQLGDIKMQSFLPQELNKSALISFNEQPFLWGCVSGEWLRIAMAISEEPLPCFLVSMDYHRNIMFNKAALELLHSTPHKLLTKSLPKFWVPKLEPVDYSEALPTSIVDFNEALRTSSSSRLNNFKFQGWKENAEENTAEWVEWTENVEYVELPNGGHARKMTVWDWREMAIPSN